MILYHALALLDVACEYVTRIEASGISINDSLEERSITDGSMPS